MQHPPFLIVGQGLTGSLVALSLLERGAAVTVVDDGAVNTPSRITPGLATPIAGPRLTFPPSGAESAAGSWQRYRQLERWLGRPLLSAHEILHMAGGREELRQFQKRKQDPAFARWLGMQFSAGAHDGLLADPWGGFEIHGGQVNVPALLSSAAEILRAHGALHAERVTVPALTLDSDGILWKRHRYREIIFCEGPAGTENPWLSGVGLQHVPGEVLTVRPRSPIPRHIYHGRVGYLAPQPGQGNLFRLGATYGTPNTPAQTTEAGRQGLLEQLPWLLSRPPCVEVVDHLAGTRPATPQRRPVVGRIPGKPAAVLNGMGARAMLQAPYLAECLAAHLLADTPLPAGVLQPEEPR
ncbi:MAG: NAD(P)/FAD-dependent oxidoreductase [Halorhodospira sp.]